MEALARYAVHDEYVVQEMILLYKSASAQKRVELLSDWYGQVGGSLPFEVAKLAVEDPADCVRYWMARNAFGLDYRDRDSEGDERDDKHQERNLEARLRADPVPIIRAVMFENPELCHLDHFRGHNLDEHLAAMSNLERLALVRSSNRSLLSYVKGFVAMDLPPKDRQDLILALVANRDFVEGYHSGDAEHRYHRQQAFGELWDAISRLPGAQPYPNYFRIEFFRRIGAPGDKKAEIYKASENERVRLAILEGCNGSHHDVRGVLDLGTSDTDPGCRELAYSKLPLGMVQEKLKSALKGTDKASIRGLYSNPNVTDAQLRATDRRWHELKPEERELETPIQYFHSPTWRFLQDALDNNVRRIGTIQVEEAQRHSGLWFQRLFSSSAWDTLWGLFVVGLSLALVITCHSEQRALLSLLIIVGCMAVIIAKAMPYRFYWLENYAMQGLDELKKLFGAKDLTRSEKQNEAQARFLEHWQKSVDIREFFLAVASLVGLGGLIVSLLQ